MREEQAQEALRGIHEVPPRGYEVEVGLTDPHGTQIMADDTIVAGSVQFRTGTVDHWVGRLEVKDEQGVADAWEAMCVPCNVVGPVALGVQDPTLRFVEAGIVSEFWTLMPQVTGR